MLVVLLFKAGRKIMEHCLFPLFTPYARIILYLNGAIVGKGIDVKGFIKVIVTRRGKLQIGENLHINSGNNFNIIGRQQKNIFWIEGTLCIGNNVGMSSSAIICNHIINIGDNVTIGGNTVIYDTDFHSLNPIDRQNKKLDKLNSKKLPVIIHKNVFIGAHTTILKGVTIGENSIIGACSLVSKSIPANEIWAGNPAIFIKKFNE